MECPCIALLSPVVMVTRGLVFHPLFCMVLISVIVFGVFVHEGLFMDLLWQYVNLMN